MAYFRDIKAFAAAALAALDRPVEDSPQAFLTNAYQATQISPRRIRRSAYDEALSTGRFIDTGQAPVRELTANFYNGVETTEVTLQNITPYRENVRTHTPAGAQEAVRNQCPEGLVATRPSYVLNVLPKNCVIKMDDAEAVRHAAAVRAVPTVRSDLVRLMADMDVRITLASFIDGGAKVVRDQLSKAD